MKQLIINADDFGMSKEVNTGIRRGIEQGVITSVSVMVNMPYFKDAIQFLRRHPQISVGLHFNLTEGKSVVIPKNVSTLIREDDNFYYWPQLIGREIFRNVNQIEIDRELNAQYEALRATGLPITHIDTHHHVHLYPSIFKIVSKFADKEKVVSLRGNYFNFWNITVGSWKKPCFTQVVVNTALLLTNLRHRNKAHLFEINRFYDINWGNNMSSEDFLKILNNLPDGTTEFICHLAVESETGNKKFLTPRYKALKLLTNSLIKNYLLHKDITLSPHQTQQVKKQKSLSPLAPAVK